MKFKRTSFAATSAIAISVAAFSHGAYAQVDGDNASAGGDTIVVTGSRIQRKDYDSPSPLVTTDIDTYTASGRATVDDFLRDLPQFGPGSGDFSNDSNGGTAGRATLNLRNLSARRNLVLMDGRRLMSSGTDGAIDINTIPSLAIGSIEVITGGASATYGSDALSGVVNFKTRTDLDGFHLDGQFSTPDGPGENTFRVGGAFGTEYAGGRGNLLVSAEYTDRGGVRLLEREFFAQAPQASSFTPYGSARFGRSLFSLDNNGDLFNASDVNAPAGSAAFTDPVESPLIVDGRGTLRYCGQCENFLQVPLEQLNLFAKSEYEMGENATLYGQVLYADSTAFNEGAPPISAGIWGVTIPFDNFAVQNNADLAALVGTNDIGNYQVRFTQAGGRIYNTENRVLQFLGGVRGQVPNRDLNWDVHVSFGETETVDRTISGSVNFAAVQEIVDSTDAAGNSPLCAGGFNPFGGSMPLSADCLAFVSRTPVNKTTLEQFVVEGVLEGALMEMPAGQSRFALTATYRENEYTFVPDPDIATGSLANLASAGFTQGDVSVYEIAGEVLLPIISDAAFMDALNLSLGARFSDYDPAGTTGTYKAEFDARLNDNILLRGGYQRAVRAPNVEEFFRASLLRVQPFSDPCSSRFSGPPAGSPEDIGITSICTAQLADPGYTQGGSSGPTFTNGNPNLTPEKADTFTVGGVLDFDLQNVGIQFTADYYTIDIEDAIETLTAQQVFTQCFNLDGVSNPAYDPSLFQCQQINRPVFAPATTSFDLNPVNQPVLNLGGIKTAGIDLATNVDVPIDAFAWGGGDGGIVFRSLINILTKHEIQAFEGLPFTDFAGTVTNVDAFPDLKMLNTVTVNTGPVRITGAWRHIAGMEDLDGFSNTGDVIEIPAFNYFDLTANVGVNDKFEFYGGVNNVGNKLPPQIGGPAGGAVFANTNQGVYDAIGRTFFFGARARF